MIKNSSNQDDVTSESPKSATIEDKLNELYDFIDRGILSKTGRIKYRQMLQAIITTETTKAAQIAYELGKAEARLDDRAAALQKERHDLP